MSKGAGVGGGRSVPFRGSPNVPPQFSNFIQPARRPALEGYGQRQPSPADMQKAQSEAYFQNQGPSNPQNFMVQRQGRPASPQFMYSQPQQNYRTSFMPSPMAPGNFAPMPSRGSKGGMGGGMMQPLPQNLGSPTMYMGMGSSPNYGVPSSMMRQLPQNFGYAGFNNGGLTRSGIGGVLG